MSTSLRPIVLAAALTACAGLEGELLERQVEAGPDVQEGPVASEHLWSRGFGSTGGDRGMGVATAPGGDVLLAGDFGAQDGQPIDCGGGVLPAPAGGPSGGGGAFLARYAGANGAHLWSRTMVGSGWAQAMDVAADSDGSALVTGSAAGSIDFGSGPVDVGHAAFVARYSTTGELVWVRLFDGTEVYGGAQLGLARDRVYAAIWFRGTVTVGPRQLGSAGGADVVLVALDGTGEVLWSRQLGGPGEDTGRGAAGREDGAAVAGGSEGPIDLEGGGRLEGAGAFVARYDRDGGLQWTERVSGKHATSVAFHADGSLSICGSTRIDGPAVAGSFLAHYSATGEQVWWRTPELRTSGSITTLAIDRLDRIVMTGADRGAFIEVHDPSGTTVIVRRYTEGAMGWDVDASGEALVLSGQYQPWWDNDDQAHLLDLGGGALPDHGDLDVFVGRLRLPGDEPPAE